MVTLLIYSLAVFRLTLMVTEEAGPGWIFKKFRREVKRKAPKKTHLDEGIECPWCVSMQIALVYAFLIAWLPAHWEAGWQGFRVVSLALALSAAAILLRRALPRS